MNVCDKKLFRRVKYTADNTQGSDYHRNVFSVSVDAELLRSVQNPQSYW